MICFTQIRHTQRQKNTIWSSISPLDWVKQHTRSLSPESLLIKQKSEPQIKAALIKHESKVHLTKIKISASNRFMKCLGTPWKCLNLVLKILHPWKYCKLQSFSHFCSFWRLKFYVHKNFAMNKKCHWRQSISCLSLQYQWVHLFVVLKFCCTESYNKYDKICIFANNYVLEQQLRALKVHWIFCFTCCMNPARRHFNTGLLHRNSDI